MHYSVMQSIVLSPPPTGRAIIIVVRECPKTREKHDCFKGERMNNVLRLSAQLSYSIIQVSGYFTLSRELGGPPDSDQIEIGTRPPISIKCSLISISMTYLFAVFFRLGFLQGCTHWVKVLIYIL